VHSQILDISANKIDTLCRAIVAKGGRIIKVKTDCVWYDGIGPLDPHPMRDGADLLPLAQSPYFGLKAEDVDRSKFKGNWQADWSGREVLSHEVSEWRVVREEVDERVSGAVAERLCAS
jgi:hypothetical protein